MKKENVISICLADIIQPKAKEGNRAICHNRMNLESIKISQTGINFCVISLTCGILKKKKKKETEIRLMADRGGRDGEILVKRNNLSFKMRKFWGSNVERRRPQSTTPHHTPERC